VFELIVVFYILWFVFANYAVKHEEELRDIWKWAKEITDSLLGEEDEEVKE